jgi:hypothetical protein
MKTKQLVVRSAVTVVATGLTLFGECVLKLCCGSHGSLTSRILPVWQVTLSRREALWDLGSGCLGIVVVALVLVRFPLFPREDEDENECQN